MTAPIEFVDLPDDPQANDVAFQHLAHHDIIHETLRRLTTPGAFGKRELAPGSVGAEQLEQSIYAMILAGSGGGGTPARSVPDQKLDSRMARAASEDVATAWLGSSSTEGYYAGAETARFVNISVTGLQLLNPSGRVGSNGVAQESMTKNSTTASFTPYTQSGVHGYNVGKAGTTSANFITDAEITRLAALDPALWNIMIGSNDYKNQMPLATYKANVQSVVTKIKTAMASANPTSLYQIRLVHSYQRFDVRNLAITWASYGTQLRDIAVADAATTSPVVIYTDASTFLPGIPGANDTEALATKYIDVDRVHMSPSGHSTFGKKLFTAITGRVYPVGVVSYEQALAAVVADGFNRPEGIGLGRSDSGHQWVESGTWSVQGNKAACTAGSGLALVETTIADQRVQDTVTVPTTGSLGLRGLSIGSQYGVAYYFEQSTLLLRASLINNGAIVAKTNVAYSAIGSPPTGSTQILTADLPTTGTDAGKFKFYLNNVEISALAWTATADELALLGRAAGMRSSIANTGTHDDFSVTVVPAVAPTASTVYDTFNRTGTTLGTADNGSVWTVAQGTMATDGTQAYVTTSPALATIAGGARNGRVAVDTKVPAADGFNGLAGRITGATSRVTITINGTTKAASLGITTGGTAVAKVDVAIPNAPAAGTPLTVWLDMNDKVLTGWVNGVQLPGLIYTLTDAEDAAIQGTGVGLRGIGTGTTTGGFNALSFTPAKVGAGGPVVVATDTFTGAAGSPWSDQWTSTFGAGPAATINASGQGVLTTPASAYGSARAQYLVGMPAIADIDLTFDWAFDGVVEQYFVIGIRSAGTVDQATGNMLACYTIGANPTGAGPSLVRRGVGGGATVLGTFPWTYTTGQRLSFRFQAIGSTIQFKMWVTGTAEPAAWGVTVTDFEYAGAGRVFIRYGSGATATARTGTIDNIVVTNPTGSGGGGGTPAVGFPLVRGNEEFPDINARFIETYANDYNTPSAIGAPTEAAYPELRFYRGWYDTRGTGLYKGSDYTSVEGGALTMGLGFIDGVQMSTMCLPWGYSMWQYGSVEFLLWCDTRIEGKKMANLWWPESNVWSDGEWDYPECGIGNRPSAFVHDVTGTPKVNRYSADPISTVTTLEKHVYKTEWTPTMFRFKLDGKEVGRYTGTEGQPRMRGRYGFQLESALSGFVPTTATPTNPAVPVYGKVRVGWVKFCRYEPIN